VWKDGVMGVRSRATAGGAQFALAVSSSVITLTVPKGAYCASIFVRGYGVTFTTDGATDPTATKGFTAVVNSEISLNSLDELNKARFIRVSSDATMDVEYFTDVSS